MAFWFLLAKIGMPRKGLGILLRTRLRRTRKGWSSVFAFQAAPGQVEEGKKPFFRKGPFSLLNLSRRSLKGEDGTPPLSSPPEPCAEEDSQTFLRHFEWNRRIYHPILVTESKKCGFLSVISDWNFLQRFCFLYRSENIYYYSIWFYDGILIFALQKSKCRKKVWKRMMGFGEEGKKFPQNFFPSSPITKQPLSGTEPKNIR